MALEGKDAWGDTRAVLSRDNAGQVVVVGPLRVEEFDYSLPQELIAQIPLERRDESRLMVLYRSTGRTAQAISRCQGVLAPGDALVVNDTRVIPARMHGIRATGGKIEVLLLKDLGR